MYQMVKVGGHVQRTLDLVCGEYIQRRCGYEKWAMVEECERLEEEDDEECGCQIRLFGIEVPGNVKDGTT